MPFERIGTCQAVIAGQRQRVLDHRNRVIGDGQLDGVGFGWAQQNAIVVIGGKAVDQAGIDGETRFDAADDILRPRQRGKRCA
jgi:hypothetical protein